jgi:hypothetical protein
MSNNGGSNGTSGGRQGFIFKIINTGLGGFIALYLSYHLVEVFLPALIAEMKAHTGELANQTELLSEHVTRASAVESAIPLLVNLSTQECVNNARANGQASSTCFAVARGEQPR